MRDLLSSIAVNTVPQITGSDLTFIDPITGDLFVFKGQEGEFGAAAASRTA